jgi:hypothetical protein
MKRPCAAAHCALDKASFIPQVQVKKQEDEKEWWTFK